MKTLFRSAVSLTLLAIATVAVAGVTLEPASAACVYPDDLDSAGRRCGGRAASERPGGYEPPPQQPQRTERSYGDPNPNNVITGTGFQGYCSLKPETNLRSNHSLTNNVIANSGYSTRRAEVHDTQIHGQRLWAWATVDLDDQDKDAWVSADLFFDCSAAR